MSKTATIHKLFVDAPTSTASMMLACSNNMTVARAPACAHTLIHHEDILDCEYVMAATGRPNPALTKSVVATPHLRCLCLICMRQAAVCSTPITSPYSTRTRHAQQLPSAGDALRSRPRTCAPCEPTTQHYGVREGTPLAQQGTKTLLVALRKDASLPTCERSHRHGVPVSCTQKAASPVSPYWRSAPP